MLQLRAKQQSAKHLELADDVLMIAWQFPPDTTGGTYRPLSIASHFARSSQPITVMARTMHDQPTSAGRALLNRLHPGVRVHRLPNERELRPSHRAFPRIDWSMPGAMQLAREAMRLYGSKRPSLVIATGPPFHSFLAGYWLARAWDVPLVIDYRDEWTQCPFGFVQLGNADLRWERRVNAAAAAIVLVSNPQMAHHLSVFGSELASKSVVIPNGWDPAAVGSPPSQKTSRESSAALTITFAGSVGSHTPIDGFLDSFGRLISRRRARGLPELKLQFIGRRDARAEKALTQFGEQASIVLHGHISQQEAVAAMRASDMLLIINTENLARYIPGKLYDYLASGTPILSFGKGGEIERILGVTGAGVVISEKEPLELDRAVDELSQRTGESSDASSSWLAQHTREAAAQRFLDLVRRLTSRS